MKDLLATIDLYDDDTPGMADGGRIGFAEGTPPRKTFIKEYKKFKGSDREFAEYLNKKYKYGGFSR